MKDIKILGMDLGMFSIVAIITIIAVFLGVLPQGMVGAFLFLMVFGEILNLIGNNLPIIKTWFGGGPIVVIFAGAALVYFKILPEVDINSISTFMNKGGFLDFYIAALITGSILGMNRELLIKAAIRYIPCIIGGVVFALGFVALAAPLFGKTAGEAIAYVGIPIMGGGMGAGAVPISKVFSQALNIPAEDILGKLVPAVALGNALAIVFAGILDKVGKVKPSWTGNGKLMPLASDSLDVKEKVIKTMTPSDYGMGIVVATFFFTFGAIIAKVISNVTGGAVNIHPYAWMIISVAVAKAMGIIPEKYENACAGWYQLVANNFTAALLLGIGMAYTDLGDIISAFTPAYFVLVFLVVLGAVIGSGIVGKLVGFYPIETAITAGLCMANMGGTGDVAVLTASKRMELMPFAQISSRLGGALIILLASVLVPIFFG